MLLEELTFAAFAACNSVRVIAYLPQIYKAATDRNGASAISCLTWSLFLFANISTTAYALINRGMSGWRSVSHSMRCAASSSSQQPL